MNVFAQHILDQRRADELARIQRMQRAWEIYNHSFPLPLAVQPGKADDNVIVNFCRWIVDTSVSMLFGTIENDLPIEVITDGESDELRSSAEQYLDRVFGRRRKMLFLHDLGVTGAVTGQAVVLISASPDSSLPKLSVVDPVTLSVITDPHDVDTAVYYRINYEALDPATGRPRLYQKTIEQTDAGWLITDSEAEPGGSYTTVDQVQWPYSWPPVVACKNLPCPNSWWGTADLEESVIRQNLGLNAKLSNANRILRLLGHPRTVGIGLLDARFDVGPDQMLLLPPSTPDNQINVFTLPMVENLSSHMDLIRLDIDLLHMTARLPQVLTGNLRDLNSDSGVAIRLLYQPALHLIGTKRLLYGELLADLCRRLLEYGGFGPDHDIAIQWPEILPRDDMAERQALQMELDMGVSSRERIAGKLGIDWNVERDRIMQEKEEEAALQSDLTNSSIPPFSAGEPGIDGRSE